MKIQFFDEINESHLGTGYRGRTDLPGFHIYTIEDTYPHTRPVMPPYRLNFYQIVLLENSGDAVLNMNTNQINDLDDTLAFASPQHVLAWVRGAAQRGYIIFFKENFLPPRPAALPEEFPFFRLSELNLMKVSAGDKPALRERLEQLLAVFRSEHPYRVPILQAQLLVALFECKRLYDQQQLRLEQATTRNILTYRFEQFVERDFLTRKTVEAYAELMAISADYLSQVIKATTGKTAHHLIAERILHEAKNLLSYTDLPIAEVALYLGYNEPTHFTRFFRHRAGVSPLAWRQQQRQTQESGHFTSKTG